MYLIRHRASREYCAAKHQKWVTPDTQRTARREAAVLRRLGAGHQNHIVHYIDYFEVNSIRGPGLPLRMSAKISDCLTPPPPLSANSPNLP